MKRHFVKIHTGPCDVNAYADRLETSGWPVAVRGTEAIYLWVDDHQDGWGSRRELDKIATALGFQPQSTTLRSVQRMPD